MNHFLVLIGSNYQSDTNISNAIATLTEELKGLFCVSSVFRCAAIDKSGQEHPEIEPYDNLVGFGLTDQSMNEVIALLKSTETKCGRIRSEINNKTVHLDLDLVEWNDQIVRKWEFEQHFYTTCKKNLLEKIQTIFSNNEFSKFALRFS